MNTGGKIITIVFSVLLLAFIGFAYFKFFFVYSEGTSEGNINYFQYEGLMFKTYEGNMIQTKYNSNDTSTTVQSNEFKFSVVNEHVAQQIDNNSSRQVKLHWKRYLGTLPWRGNSQFVVDSIILVAPKMVPSVVEGNQLDVPTSLPPVE